VEKYVIRQIGRPDPGVLEQFGQFDVSTVYEAQGKIGLIRGIRPVQQGASICGPAVTAVCYAGDNLMIHAAIEVCQPGDVLVVSTIGEGTHGMVGELIVTALMRRGVKGLIIDSGVRDVRRIREMGFPVWAKAISPEGTTKSRGGWVNAEAVCGGCVVRPGDLVLADDDGIVTVRREDAPAVIELVRQRMAREEKTKERIMNGELSVDFYHLRETLAKEKVNYYDTGRDRPAT